MIRHLARRWLAGLGVAGALLAASATPASADEAFRLVAHDVLLAKGFYHPYESIELYAGDTALQGVTLDLDLSEVEKFATIDPLSKTYWDCTRDSATLHCESKGNHPQFLIFSYYLVLSPGAEIGEKGDLPIVATSGGTTVTRTITVSVAESVDLQAGRDVDLGAEPGATIALPPATVHNDGPNTTHGAVAVLHLNRHVFRDARTSYVGNFSNCEHVDDLGAICRFDTELKPGKTYRLSEPLPVRLTETAVVGHYSVSHLQWWTKEDWAVKANDPSDPVPPGLPGTGKELRLVEVSTARAAGAPQTDIDRFNSETSYFVRVTGADLVAVGSSVSGAEDDTIRVTAGIKNLGPPLVKRTSGSLGLRVDIPEGTVAVEAPQDCTPLVEGPWEGEPPNPAPGSPNYQTYICSPEGDLAKDQSVTFEFGLYVDWVIPDVVGAVRLEWIGDSNLANNSAKIVINPTDDGGSDNPGGDDDNPGDGDSPGGDDGQGGGDGGSLPITGANAGLIAGIGGVLLAAGAAGFVVARRRKTRFVA